MGRGRCARKCDCVYWRPIARRADSRRVCCGCRVTGLPIRARCTPVNCLVRTAHPTERLLCRVCYAQRVLQTVNHFSVVTGNLPLIQHAQLWLLGAATLCGMRAAFVEGAAA